MKIDHRFEARDIQRLLGINRNRLFYWTHTHRLLVPGIAAADGTGKRAIFSAKNLVELAVMKALVDFGTDLRSIKIIKGYLDRKRDEFNGGNAFDFALKTEGKENYKLWLYRIGSKQVSARMRWLNPVGDVDVNEDGPHPVPAEETLSLDKGKDKLLDESYVSTQIDIGRLAKEVISKMT